MANNVDFLDDYNGFPICLYSNKGLETKYVAEVIHFKQYDTNRKCVCNPSIFNINASFLIDKLYLTHEKDISYDLHGHLKLSKTKELNFCIDKSRPFKVSVNTALPKSVAVDVTRSIYYHCFHKDFHKILLSIDGNSIVSLKYHFESALNSCKRTPC